MDVITVSWPLNKHKVIAEQRTTYSVHNALMIFDNRKGKHHVVLGINQDLNPTKEVRLPYLEGSLNCCLQWSTEPPFTIVKKECGRLHGRFIYDEQSTLVRST